MIKLCDKSIIPAISLIYKIASTQEFFLIYGRNPVLSQFLRKVISKSLKITGQFHFYQSLVKYSKSLFLIHCLNLFIKLICLMRINQDSDHLIHVNINSYQLYMIYMHLLTVTHLMMLEVYSWTYQRLLIEYGMKDLFIK